MTSVPLDPPPCALPKSLAEQRLGQPLPVAQLLPPAVPIIWPPVLLPVARPFGLRLRHQPAPATSVPCALPDAAELLPVSVPQPLAALADAAQARVAAPISLPNTPPLLLAPPVPTGPLPTRAPHLRPPPVPPDPLPVLCAQLQPSTAVLPPMPRVQSTPRLPPISASTSLPTCLPSPLAPWIHAPILPPPPSAQPMPPVPPCAVPSALPLARSILPLPKSALPPQACVPLPVTAELELPHDPSLPETDPTSTLTAHVAALPASPSVVLKAPVGIRKSHRRMCRIWRRVFRCFEEV